MVRMNIGARGIMSGTLEKPFTVKEFAKAADVSLNHVYNMIKRGEVPSVRLGCSIRIPRRQGILLLEGASMPGREAA